MKRIGWLFPLLVLAACFADATAPEPQCPMPDTAKLTPTPSNPRPDTVKATICITFTR